MHVFSTPHLPTTLLLSPTQDLLPAVYGVPQEFSPSAIRAALVLMTAQRVRAIWVSKQHLNEASPAPPKAESSPETAVGANENDNLRALVEASGSNGGDCGGGGDSDIASTATELLTEPVYGTRYSMNPLPADWLAFWVSAKPEDEPKCVCGGWRGGRGVGYIVGLFVRWLGGVRVLGYLLVLGCGVGCSGSV